MRRDLRRVLIFILSTALIFIWIMIGFELDTYFSQKQEKEESPSNVENRIRIGLSLGTLKEDRWLKDSELLQEKAMAYGVDLLVLNANNDDNDQLTQVKYLIKQGIDVLMLVPTDYKMAAEAVKLAKSKGIPVISYDRLVRNANVDFYISFDNFKVGALMAEEIMRIPEVKNIFIVNGAKTDYNTKLIKEGYDSVLGPYVEKGQVRIISEHWAPNWVKEHAFDYTETLLKAKIPVDAVIAGNDSLADAVYEALSQFRQTEEVYLVGQDADLTACQRVVEGSQLMTVYKPIDLLVTTAIETALKLAKNERVYTEQTINDGTYEVNCFLLSPIPVTRENMEETVIKDQFHLKEEVYLKP